MGDFEATTRRAAAPGGRATAARADGSGCRPNRLLGWLVAVVVPAAWGAIAGWWTPRSPLTTSEALWSIGISLAVGVIAGAAVQTRWMMLGAPALFAGVFELVRLGTDGPTVDGIHATFYGLFAFTVGRGFHALISVLPMALGAAFGASYARRSSRAPGGRGWGRSLRRGVAVLTAVGLVGFAAVLARPAVTEPIAGPDGRPLAGSVAELSSVEVDDRDLGMMIRGHDAGNPVVLFLAGGPGGSEHGAMRNHLPELEKYFTVATWDQRGAGTSYPALDPTSTYTLDSAVADTIAVTNYLRQRFGQDQIFLLGQSWGTTLGVLAVRQQPQLYAAYVGTGQMVDPLETDEIFYRDTLAWARRSGNTSLADRLTTIGPPPYQDMLNYETALAHEQEVYPYDHTGNSEGPGGFSENFIVPEYALIDQVHLLGAFMDTFAVLYPQLQGIDFRTDVPTLPVPVYFVEGAHEAPGRAEPFQQWYAALRAPRKELTVLEHSGHRPLFEQPHQFVTFMTDTVLAQTTRGQG